MSLNTGKQLPSLPGYLSTPTGASSMPLAPSSTCGRVTTEPSHPTLELEDFPPSEELALFRSWNDATAAGQVRFQRKPTPGNRPRSFPPPMSEAEIVALSNSRANDNAASKKRWGSFTRKRPADTHGLEEKEPETSMPNRSRKFLDIGTAARSTPNLNETANASARKSSRFAPCDTTASTPTLARHTYSPIDQLASTSAPTYSTDAPVDEIDEAEQALGIDMNDGDVDLTFNPDRRSSRGKAVLTFCRQFLTRHH